MVPILLGLSLAYFLSFVGLGWQMANATPALEAAGIGAATLGSMASLRFSAMIFAPGFWGIISDRLGRSRPAIMATLLLGGASMLWLAFYPSQGHYSFLLYGLSGGVSASLLDGFTLTALGDDKRRYGAIRRFATVGFGTGALLGGLMVRFFAFEQTPKSIFVWPALALFATAGIFLFFRAPTRARMRSVSELWPVLRMPAMWFIAFLGLCAWGSHGVYMLFLPNAARSLGGDALTVGLALAVASTCEIVVMSYAKFLLGRLGIERALFLALVGAMVRWSLLATTSSLATFVLLQALHGLTFGLFYIAAVAFLAESVPEQARQSAQGVFFAAAFGVGGAIGVSVAGYVVGHHSVRLAFMSMAGISGLGVLAFILRRIARGR